MLIPLGFLGGGGSGDLVLISTQVLASTASTVTFSSIANSYKHLQLRVVSRTSASSVDTLQIRFNGDSGTNYAWHRLQGDGAAGMQSVAGATQNYANQGFVADSTSAASAFAPSIVDILDYANTTTNKTVRGVGGIQGSLQLVALKSSVWLSASAISSITIGSNGGGVFQVGSRFSLYGVKG